MARDTDLVRQLLLAISEQETSAIEFIEELPIDGYTHAQISHHIWLLGDGGFLKCIDLSDLAGADFRACCLTYRGHEFLEMIRERDAWQQITQTAKSLGNHSLEAVWTIAKKLAEKRLQKAFDLA